MSEPLSDAEVAELRRLQRAVDEDVHHIDNGAENARDDAAGAALSRLLDELELLRRRDEEMGDLGARVYRAASPRGSPSAVPKLSERPIPTEPLTDQQIAELRRVTGIDFDPIRPSKTEADAFRRLLAELERLRKRDREWTAGEEVLRQQLRDAERRIEMLRGG